MSAPVSDRPFRMSAATRIIIALIIVPFSLVVGPIALFLLLARFVVTGEKPGTVEPPREDLQAAAIRAVLAQRNTTIH